MAREGAMIVSEVLEEPARPLASVIVAVNVRSPTPAPAFTVIVLVQTLEVVLSNTRGIDELPPTALASKVTLVTAASPLMVTTLTKVLWPHVIEVGEAVMLATGGRWLL